MTGSSAARPGRADAQRPHEAHQQDQSRDCRLASGTHRPRGTVGRGADGLWSGREAKLTLVLGAPSRRGAVCLGNAQAGPVQISQCAIGTGVSRQSSAPMPSARARALICLLLTTVAAVFSSFRGPESSSPSNASPSRTSSSPIASAMMSSSPSEASPSARTSRT